jgi:hypothetical protein
MALSLSIFFSISHEANELALGIWRHRIIPHMSAGFGGFLLGRDVLH